MALVGLRWIGTSLNGFTSEVIPKGTRNNEKRPRNRYFERLGDPRLFKTISKTNRLEHLGCLAPKSSKTARLLTNWSMYLDLDPLSQMIPKQTFWSLQTTPSEGFGVRGLSKRHLPQGGVFPGLSKRHPPRRLGLLGMYIRRTSRPCLPSLSKRHPPKGFSPIFQGVQSEQK